MTTRTIRHVAIGTMLVSTDQEEVLYTCVGSCVAVALFDDSNKIAGLIHIVLPGNRTAPRGGDSNAFYADTGIPLLIAEMEHQGAVRSNLKAAIVGGACLKADIKHSIGSDNTAQVLSLLAKASIPVTKKQTGGDCGRTIRIWVKNGDLQIQEIRSGDMVPIATKSEKLLTGSPLNQISQTLAHLQPSPQVATKLFDAIHQSAIDWHYVEEILWQDFVLALHVLQMCNSRYYGVPGEIDSFNTALSRLGAHQFRRVCVVAAAEKYNENLLSKSGIDQKDLSRHCLASAIAAQHIAAKVNPDLQLQVFAAALLHPIGCIAAQLADGNINPESDIYALDDCLFLIKHDSEIAIQHRHLARTLLSQWHIPPIIIEAISPLNLPDIEQEKLSPAIIVKASCIISSMLGIRASKEKANVEFSLYALEQLELSLINDLLFAEIITKLRTKGLLS
nr:HDOD domain-containing protein [Desulfobulbaceae bacterium]